MLLFCIFYYENEMQMFYIFLHTFLCPVCFLMHYFCKQHSFFIIYNLLLMQLTLIIFIKICTVFPNSDLTTEMHLFTGVGGDALSFALDSSRAGA